MVILSLTVVPFFTRARVYTAYEYLERRFDVRVRSLASFLFLIGRAASLGVTLAAPSVVMSAILGWSLPVTVLVICIPMIAYTTIGGVQAVAWTDVKQMFIVVFGMSAAVVVLLYGILQHVGFGQALQLAGATGRLKAVDFSFNLSETYTFWSAMFGGLFLMLSYFGCDQSQVQRYLTAKSIDEARQSLMMSAWVKIPLQLLILATGVLVFVFYLFNTPPMLFNRVYDAQVAASPRAAEYSGLQQAFDGEMAARRDAALRVDRGAFIGQRRAAQGHPLEGGRRRQGRPRGDDNYSDVNYVFPTFITTQMPIGLVGLMIAAIFAAAMSASGGELNALATATVIDFYRRHFVKDAADAHYVRRVEARDVRLGPVRLLRRDTRGEPGVAHRGRQPIRLVRLRIAARRLHPRDPDEASDGARRLLGADRRHGGRADRRHPDAVDRVSLAQPHRCVRRGRGRHGDQLHTAPQRSVRLPPKLYDRW